MAINPNSLKNLEKGTKFYPGDPRIKRDGRTPGKRNLKNIFAAWLETETDCKDPAGNDVQLPLVDKVILALINKASRGDVSAANLVLGKAYDKQDEVKERESANQPIDWDAYTEEEVQQLIALLKKGSPESIIELPYEAE